MKNTKLRVLWMVPNIAMYLVFIGLTVFVMLNGEELRKLHLLNSWLLRLALLLLVALLGTFRILSWIRQGKM